MNFHDYRGSRGRGRAKVKARPEASEGLYRLALKWREEWHKDKCRAKATEQVAIEKTRDEITDQDEKRRAKFAASIARAEFGRNYWDERRERAAARAPKRPPEDKRRQ